MGLQSLSQESRAICFVHQEVTMWCPVKSLVWNERW